MGTGECINIFMAAQPCNTANGYWGLHQCLHGYSALSHCKWVLGIASTSSRLLSPVTLQMGTGDFINIFMATQPCQIANGYWGLHQYLHGYSALSYCKWELGIASISSWLLSPVTLQMGTGVYIKCFLWLLSPVTLQMGTGECINIFMAAQPRHTANGYWGLHQYLHGYSALAHCKWVLGIASISSWLLSPVKLQMGTGDCISIFMATQPCHIANGNWGLHQYVHGYSALSHCKWVLGFTSNVFLWLLSPVTLQMGTGECINIFMVTQPCHIANGY